jgi:GSH-dependent disulfide-bond oxidoreductase
MIEVLFWPTPNGYKVTLFLEEAGLPYELTAVNIGAGDQFKPEFLAKSPNNRIPAIIDHAPADGGEPISVFESGAILVYLAEKTGRFLPTEARAKKTVLEWLFWQVGGFGPMLGQNHHFNRYAPVQVPYAIERYTRETERLYGVLDRHLKDRAFVAGSDYSIADMAIYPWAKVWEYQKIDISRWPDVQRWMQAIAERPATRRAYARGEPLRPAGGYSQAAHQILFGQSATATDPKA